MKRLLVLLVVLCVCSAARAQISVGDTREQPQAGGPVDDTADNDGIESPDYFSADAERARRKAIRHERNNLEYSVGLMGTVTSFSESWIKTSGGDNSIGIASTAYIYHTYTKDKFSLTSKFDAKFGFNRMNVERVETDGTTSEKQTWFKNQDEFQISTSPAWNISRDWALASIIRFRSQFANGYVSRSQQESANRKSGFLAPGYFDVSFGFTYTSPDKRLPFVVNISPLAVSGTFVSNEVVRGNEWDSKKGWMAYGLASPDQRSRWEGGSSIQVGFDRTFDKQGIVRYRTSLYSFMGWLSKNGEGEKFTKVGPYEEAMKVWEAGGEVGGKPMLAVHPTVRWENTIDIKAMKFLTTTISVQLYYNRAQHYNLQTQLLLSVGLTYTFNNKPKE